MQPAWSDFDDARRRYYETLDWRRKSAETLRRACYICEVCRSRPAVMAHHRTYERFGGSEIWDDLVAVCRTCHDDHHRWINRTAS